MDGQEFDLPFELRFPMFFIAQGDENHVVVVEAGGKDWALLYSSKELAELYIEQSKADCFPSPANDEDQLARILVSDAGLAGFILDPLLTPSSFQFLYRDEFV